MPTTVTFFPGRKKNQRNPVIDWHRFTKDRSRNGNTYYKCTLFKDGCRARIFPSRDSVHRFGIQYESEFSAQIFLAKIGIQEFRPSRNSVREPKPHTDYRYLNCRREQCGISHTGLPNHSMNIRSSICDIRCSNIECYRISNLFEPLGYSIHRSNLLQ